MTLHDWRLVPVAAGAWGGAFAGTSGDGVTTVLVAVVSGVAAAALRRHTALVVGLMACALLAVSSGLLAGQRGGSSLAALADDGAVVDVAFRVVSEPRPRPARPPMPPSATALAETRWVEGRGERVGQRLPVVLSASGELAAELLELQTGAVYVATAKLAAAEPGDSAVAFVRIRSSPRLSSGPGALDALAAGLREGLRQAVAGSPAPQRALVPSLVVGDTSRVTQAMADEFKATGLTHLMAVSGANLALMLGVVLAVLRTVGVRGWAVRIVAAGCVGMFVVVCGPEPSVRRAAVMGLVAVAATGAGKRRRSVRALSVAVCVLMVLDPWLSRAPGFWLSVAACFGIVVLGPPWIDAMCNWAPRWVSEVFAIALASQVATQPIVTWLSGEISLVGVLANVLAGPFVGPTTVLGFAAACLTPLPPLSAFVGWAAGWASQPILWIAGMGAALPNATVAWVPGALGLLMVIALSAALLPLAGPVLRRAGSSLLAVILLTVAALLPATPPGWPGEWDFAFCDVGQGDATVLRAEGDTAVLVDSGPEPAPVLDCLDALGVRRLSMVVLTHYHADHIGGFEAVVRRYRPPLVLVSPLASPPYAAAAVAAVAGDATLRPAVPGERIAVGSLVWTTVAAAQPSMPGRSVTEGESAAENDASVVGLAERAGTRLLLPGDAEPDGQRRARSEADALGLGLRAEVLKLPHHGSSRQDRDFLAQTGARLAVVSAGEGNAYGHPAPGALALVQELGMVVARTDTEGTITVEVSADGLAVRRSGG